MKRLALFAALTALLAMPAWGQTSKTTQSVKSPAAETKKSEPMAEDIKPTPRQLTERSRLDARECLKHSTNKEIIVCAEKFL
ncbi:MAG: hypothetical protein AMJ64_10000 [Betaproteobacteria bacterium SG8_39]|nr:MAG: hypothetical protein AMJ64_10000 [Betaproteobacteria bacterium SG8_39]